MKPLFIPLKAEHFVAFRDRYKTMEFRKYGARWNEKTCPPARPVVLSKGYGKQERLAGKVSFFKKCYGGSLPPLAQMQVMQIFGTTDLQIAIIGVTHLKPVERVE